MTTTALKRPLLALLAISLALSCTFPASAAPSEATAQVQAGHSAERWDLSDLYQTPAGFDSDASKLEPQLQQFAGCKGQLGASSARLKSCLDLYSEVHKRLDRLKMYASLYFYQDTGDKLGNQLNQHADLLDNQFSQATAFVQPEILALGAKRVHAMLARDKGLGPYRLQLDTILRNAPHTLDAAGEQLVSQFGLATGSASAIYQTLSSSEMPWSTIKLSDGTEATIDLTAYEQYREVSNRADRKLVFDTYWGKWKQFEHTFGATLYGKLKTDAAYAKVRYYPDSQTAALDADHMPPAVYQTLIAQTNANLPTLHRYFKLRARMLGIKDMAYYDLYPPLVNSTRTFTLAESKQMMLAAVAPLGADYVKTLSAAVNARWMDVYPSPRKLPAALTLGDAYDVHPYVLLNYTGNYASVTTMTHEWGHAMHSVLSNKAQPAMYAPYSIFVAEIASTTNEALLLEHQLTVARDDDERLLYLGEALDELRGVFFRQAMFAEFEAAIHAKVDQGVALTGAQISAIYLDLLKRYHGVAQCVMTIDPLYSVEWAYLPHFYENFYVFKYATSIAAAQEFAQRILANTPGAREAYLKMLSSGSSADPYALVKAAGVDLATPQPYQALAARMNSIMDQIEAIEGKRGK
ncbi:oligoendopeptidase F [Janthinobacterium sp.]|uniref:oligoendopeptidase F n=1 Tax=Janthinobacterium sp. TaxID=1871054 RepID=UPI002612C4FF|nr:oligoendopeptidase F [Janthinobacterium sp.]